MRYSVRICDHDCKVLSDREFSNKREAMAYARHHGYGQVASHALVYDHVARRGLVGYIQLCDRWRRFNLP